MVPAGNSKYGENVGFLNVEEQNLYYNVKTKVNLTHRWRCGYTLYWNVTPNVRATHRCPYFEFSKMDFKQGIEFEKMFSTLP